MDFMDNFHRTQQRVSQNLVTQNFSRVFEVRSMEDIKKLPRFYVWPEKIEEIVGQDLPECRYFFDLLERFALHVQDLPLPSTLSLPSGFFSVAVARAHSALAFAKTNLSYQSPDEALKKQDLLWLFTIFSGTLLHMVGNLALDFSVSCLDAHQKPIGTWNIYTGPMTSTHYQYATVDHTHTSMKEDVTLLLAHTMMPSEAFSWIASERDLLEIWLSLLKERHERLSFKHYVYPKEWMVLAHENALEHYFEEMLLLLAKEEDALALLEGRHPQEDFIQRLGMDLEHIQHLIIGMAFATWMKAQVAQKHLSFNKPGAMVHLTEKGLFVSEKVFQKFVAEHPAVGSLRQLVKHIEQLGVSMRDAKGQALMSFKTVDAHGKTQVSHGVMLRFPHLMLDREHAKILSTMPLAALDARLAEQLTAEQQPREAPEREPAPRPEQGMTPFRG